MPGLVGIVSENAVDEQLLDRMVDSIKHGEFYRVDKYINSRFGIARVHLGIFNPEPQPIFNEDKSLCIFMEGKIYNYEEELNKLQNRRKIIINNDPEFCLYSYEEYGMDFVRNLDGSFVFIICNLKENKVTVVNDRYGLRPLYYSLNNGKLLFASEVKAILKDKSFKKELNDKTVADFFAFGEILGNKTFFKSVEVLPPSSVFVYDGKNVSIEKYWDFDYESDYIKSEDEFVDELVNTFRKAVEVRIADNVKCGVALSGGLDSRSIVAAINKSKRKDIFSFSFGPLDCDEVKIAKKVSEKAGTKFMSLEITPDMIIENAEKCVYLSDGFHHIGASYLLPTHNFIRNYIDVIFDGYELDVILGGSYFGKKILNAKNDKELFNILLKERRVFSDDELGKLFVAPYFNKIKKYPQESLKEALDKIDETHPANKNDKYLLQNHARRYIINGPVLMRVFLEVSLPSFSNAFVEVICKLPPELRFNHYIYRKFLKKLSPELAKIPYNKTMVRADAPLFLWKIGKLRLFGVELIKRWLQMISRGKIFISNRRNYVNFDEYFKTNEKWKSFFKKLLFDGNSLSKKYFDQEYIKKIFYEQINGRKNNSLKLLYLASFELFLRLFLRDVK